MDYDYRLPSVEDAVGNHGTNRRAADYIVAIDIAAEEAIVEVVWHTMIVNRTDVARNRHVMTEVVVVRVHIGCRLGTMSSSSVVSVMLRSWLRTSLSIACITSFSVIAGCCSS